MREARWLQSNAVDSTPPSRQIRFSVDVAPEREAVRVSPVGEVDLATVGSVRERLAELRATGFQRLILDLRGVTFLDSTGVRLVLEQVAASADDGCRLLIVPGPWQVQRVFELAGLTSRLPFADGGLDLIGAPCL